MTRAQEFDGQNTNDGALVTQSYHVSTSTSFQRRIDVTFRRRTTVAICCKVKQSCDVEEWRRFDVNGRRCFDVVLRWMTSIRLLWTTLLCRYYVECVIWLCATHFFTYVKKTVAKNVIGNEPFDMINTDNFLNELKHSTRINRMTSHNYFYLS